MTDTKPDAPERMAVDWRPGLGVTSGPLFEVCQLWVRGDVAKADTQAAVAAALEHAVKRALDEAGPGEPATRDENIYALACSNVADNIRALIPADATAALGAHVAKAVKVARTDERDLVLTSLMPLLVEFYVKDRATTARICDEHIDKTGKLLGDLRKAAAIRKGDTHD